MNKFCCSGIHFWIDEASARRCCDPSWERITILPGESLETRLLEDRKLYRDGVVVAADGFKFVWRLKAGALCPTT